MTRAPIFKGRAQSIEMRLHLQLTATNVLFIFADYMRHNESRHPCTIQLKPI